MGKVESEFGIIGHFGFKKKLLNGQTVKTENIALALADSIGENNVLKFDTHGGLKALFRIPFQIKTCLKNAKNVIIMPANRGLQIIVPLLLRLNKKTKRKTHYVVIGGCLPSFCKKNIRFAEKLKRLDYIYVETGSMKTSLEIMGFSNVTVLPNFKRIKPLAVSELVYSTKEPMKLCTFSRVMKEKGIEEAVKVVELLNNRHQRIKYTLDIYGQIEVTQVDWFTNLNKSFPDYIKYRGLVDSTKSIMTIKQYYALLFPTFYSGEGFAGTILDAMAAGVPVVASNWKYNSEIINNRNGVLFETHDLNGFANAIETMNVSKIDCLEEAKKYLPDRIVKILIMNK